MKHILHLLSHFFMLNPGAVITWRDGEKTMAAFRCDKCKHVSDARRVSK